MILPNFFTLSFKKELLTHRLVPNKLIFVLIYIIQCNFQLVGILNYVKKLATCINLKRIGYINTLTGILLHSTGRDN